MITKQTKEYGDLFKKASEDLKKYNTDHKLISEAGGDPILKPTYVEIELTEDTYTPNTYYIKSGGEYVLSTSSVFNTSETYYYDASEQITSLDEFFSYIEDLNLINRKYTILPLDEDPFIIDANARTITVPKSFKDNGISVQGDEVAEIIYFKVDRFFDAVDLDMMDIYIQWRSSEVDEEGKPVEGISVPWVKDIESQPGYIIFGWPLSSKITAKEGKIQFAVRFYKYDKETEKLTYSLSTLTCTAEIKPSLDFNLPNIIKDGKEKIDDATNLINNRFVNSIGTTGGTPALAPLFVRDLGTTGIKIKDDKGNDCKEVFLDKSTGIFVDYVEAVSLDGGAITYTWKKYDYDTNERLQGQDSEGNEYMPYETTYIQTVDTERNENKVYYVPVASTDSVQGYTQYLGTIPPEDETTIIYEKVSKGTMNSIGKYIVTSTNRVKQSRQTADSMTVFIKRPSEIIIEEGKDVAARAILPAQAVDSDVPPAVNLSIKVNTQDTVDKKPNEITYQWYKKAITEDPAVQEGWEEIKENNKPINNKLYTVTGGDEITEAGCKGDGYYKVKVTNTLNKQSTSIESTVCRVTHTATKPDVATTSPLDLEFTSACKDGFSVRAEIPASAGEVGRTKDDTLTYQWYRYRRWNTESEMHDRELAEAGNYEFNGDFIIPDAVQPVFKPNAETDEDLAGYTFYCEVTNTYNGTIAKRCSNFFNLNKDS